MSNLVFSLRALFFLVSRPLNLKEMASQPAKNTRVPDTVLVIFFGANFRDISLWILQNRRKRFDKVRMKNINMVKVSPKYQTVHRVLKKQSSMPLVQFINEVYSVVSRVAWQCIV